MPIGHHSFVRIAYCLLLISSWAVIVALSIQRRERQTSSFVSAGAERSIQRKKSISHPVGMYCRGLQLSARRSTHHQQQDVFSRAVWRSTTHVVWHALLFLLFPWRVSISCGNSSSIGIRAWLGFKRFILPMNASRDLHHRPPTLRMACHCLPIPRFRNGQRGAPLGSRLFGAVSWHQKVIELAPSEGVPPETRAKILNDAVRMLRDAKYRNAGTVEFLADKNGKHYFMEVNPRVQVEHTVTEEITGIDIVQSQILIASGKTLPELGLTQDLIPDPIGFAMQVGWSYCCVIEVAA
jgi:hypothetical protein